MSAPGAPAGGAAARAVTPVEMAAIDRRAGAEHGIPSLTLMENAGRRVAEETAAFLKERLGLDPRRAPVAVVCGRGNNGGDGLVAARRLRALGAAASAFLLPPKPAQAYGPEVAANLERAEAAGVPVLRLEPHPGGPSWRALDAALASADAVVDALLGTGSSGRPAGLVETAILAIGRAGRPVVAVDVPSGLDPASGERGPACVRAALTLALGLPKTGLVAPAAQDAVGELKILDIGFPAELLSESP